MLRGPTTIRAMTLRAPPRPIRRENTLSGPTTPAPTTTSQPSDSVSTRSPHPREDNRQVARALEAIDAARARIVGSVRLRLNAEAIFDAHALAAAPGSILLEIDSVGSFPIDSAVSIPRAAARVLAVGSPAEVDARARTLSGSIQTLDLPGVALLPGLVNAHAHLDLTHLGPQPHDPGEGFVAWVDRVRAGRATTDADIRASVEQGIRLSLAGGTVAVGDIAGAPNGQPSLVPLRTLRDSPLRGVSYLETFGIGAGEPAARARLEPILEGLADLRSGPGCERVRFGLQPHAPNTVGIEFFQHLAERAAREGIPIATHLAETPEERAFIADASGPQVELLQRFGYWTDALAASLGRGHHPAIHLERALSAAPFTLAHLNDAPDEAIALLARTRAAVVYCPRASAYFAADRHFGPHRYRDLIDAGVPVALGTDSIINLPAESADPESGGIGLLGEMRLLIERDGLDPLVALGMATTRGVEALDRFGTGWIGSGEVTLVAGSTPLGINAIPLAGPLNPDDPLRDTILVGKSPRLLFCGK